MTSPLMESIVHERVLATRRASAAPESARRIVVTGMGIVAPSGIGADALWTALRRGESAVQPITRFDVSRYPVRIAAEIPDFRPRQFMTALKARTASRFCQLTIAASRLAVEDAGLPANALAALEAGLFLGTSAGPAQVGEDQSALFREHGPGGVHRTLPFALSPHSASAMAASEFGILGPIVTLSSECPAGLDAIVAGARQIAAGALDIAVVGGADAPLSPILFAGFARSGVLAESNEEPWRASRPFDRQRNGFVLGEAGAMLVIEERTRALARGARIYGELLGFGAGRDRPTYVGDQSPSGRAFLLAAASALAEADLGAGEVDHVSAHAPGVPMTDLAELRALQTLFGGSRRPVVTSIKGALGHPLAAAGVLQTAAALLAMRDGIAPPTANCDALDPECTLDVVRGSERRAPLRTTLVTAHGFGGNSTALVAGAGAAEAAPGPPNKTSSTGH
jgi:3-oxoacyl-[acyl-carrier-protein] synthase II